MTEQSAALVESGPAKINLALHVVDQRPDSYHLIQSLCVFTRFGDRLTIARSEADAFEVTGPFADQVPADEDNLVLRARDMFRGRFPRTARRVSIRLEKNIPVASGVGGGSSDAAATLRGLARLGGVRLDWRLHQLAMTIGADVPMCLLARPVAVHGIGELLDPVAAFPVLHLVLVAPLVPVETPRVFAALKTKRNPRLRRLPGALTFGSLVDWLVDARNDLYAPATLLEPVIDEALAAIRREDPAFAAMSGSGATCFGLFPDAAAAQTAARAIRLARPGWFVTATETTV